MTQAKAFDWQGFQALSYAHPYKVLVLPHPYKVLVLHLQGSSKEQIKLIFFYKTYAFLQNKDKVLWQGF